MADTSSQGSAEEDVREREISRLVLSYLHDHPNGMDDIEGILTMWVSRQRVRDDYRVLRRVLTRLVGQGVLEEVLVYDREAPRTLYRLARQADQFAAEGEAGVPP